MNRMSVIIPVYNGEKELEYTLEFLINQSVENFEVIFVDDGSTDSTAEICKKYCEEYNDFYYIYQEHKGVYAARNRGIEQAKCEYLMFLDCGDAITTNTIESIYKFSDENDADIISGRCWRHGDIEYEYDKFLDILALIPKIEMLETSLFKNFELGAKVFRKKIFDLHNIRFLDLSAYGELLFLMQAVMKGFTIGGCPDFIHEKSIKYLENGFSEFEQPSYENIKSAAYVINELFEMGREEIIRQTGTCDGDEAYLQEIVYFAYCFYIEKFYRKYWFMETRTIEFLKSEFEKYVQYINPERFKKLQKANPDLRLPYIYTDKQEAADEPEFTLFFDIVNEEEYEQFLNSLYAQTYPFFELMVSESKFSSSSFPEKYKKMENITVLPDKGFHTQARAKAKSRKCFEIKSGTPLDIRVLRETALSKAPAFASQYIFTQKRQTLNARKTLKDKGLNIG